MKRTVLFDLDGTLTDSGEGIINCARLALEHFGLPIPTSAEMRAFVGPPLHETFPRFGVPADKIDEAIRVYRSRYIPTGMFENTPYPGIKEVLEALKKNGYTLYVATSKPEEMSVTILERFGLAPYFDRIFGASTDTSRSTKDAIIAYLLEQSGAKEDMVMVGDTKYDVLGAKVHGIPTIGVSWGYGNVGEMEQAGAVGIANTMEQLLELIKKV